MRYFHAYKPLRRCVFHLRDDGFGTENASLPRKIKAITIVVLFDKAGMAASGGAACNRMDQWNRKLGVTIATGRAKKAMTKALNGEWKPDAVEPWEMGIWHPQTPDKLAEARLIVERIHNYVMGKMVFSAGGER